MARPGPESEYACVRGAWVHPTARLGEDCVLEPGALVGAGVHLGRGCRLGVGAVIYGPASVGDENRIHAGAVLGGDPQDVGYRGETTRLEIGDRNVFREHVTISRGSPRGGGVTRVGSDNYFMVGAHLGHDVLVEDRCTLANGVLVGGHCRIGSGVNLSGGTAVVQFTTIGRLAFLGGMAGARQDLEPFIIHDRPANGDARARPCGINKVGLRRAGIDAAAIRSLGIAYKLMFLREGAHIDLAAVREDLRVRGALVDEVDELIEFVRRKQEGRFGRQIEAERRRVASRP